MKSIGHAKRLISTANIDRETWLRIRRGGIGGSDVGAICGVSTHKSPIGVWIEKTRGAEDFDSVRMQRGREMEDPIARMWAKETHSRIERVNAVLAHPTEPWALANIDRLIVGQNGIKNDLGILEVKNTSLRMQKMWKGDDLPAVYSLQVHWYMFVTGLPYAVVTALIDGWDLVWRRIERDEEMIERILSIVRPFWFDNVLGGVPPVPGGTDDATNAVLEMYPDEDAREIEINDSSFAVKAQRHIELGKLIDQLDEERKALGNDIKMRMQDAKHAAIAGGYRATWSRYEQRRVDSKRFKSEEPELYEKYTKASSTQRLTIEAAD